MNIHKCVTSGIFFNRKADQSIEPHCEDIELWIRNHTHFQHWVMTLWIKLYWKNRRVTFPCVQQLGLLTGSAAHKQGNWCKAPLHWLVDGEPIAPRYIWNAGNMPPKANLWRKWCDLGVYADTINDRTESYLWFTCTSYKPYLEIKGIRTYAPYLLYVWFVPAL